MKAKYLSIYDEICEKIKNNEYKPYSKLPSENELMELYKVSRDTIRKSLAVLEQNGYIQKIKGKGSVVLEVNKFDFPVSGLISYKELVNKMGIKSETIVEKFNLLKNNRYLNKLLHGTGRDDIYEIVRVRKINGEKVILDIDYINESYIKNLTQDICRNSIYEYIEKELGLEIGFAKKEITVEQPTEEDRQYLDLHEKDMIVVVKSFVYLSDASLFQYTESKHRPDKFRFIDFARRK